MSARRQKKRQGKLDGMQDRWHKPLHHRLHRMLVLDERLPLTMRSKSAFVVIWNV